MTEKRKKMGFYNIIAEHTDGEADAKTEPYLMPGTEEYEEYTEDLREHQPFKNPDISHRELEEYNARMPVKRRDDNNSKNITTSEKKYMNYIKKDTQFNQLKKEMEKTAAKTPEITDDEKAKKLRQSMTETTANDFSVTEDEYIPKFMKKYL